MAEASRAASSPLDIDGIVVDLHTNRATAASAAQALLNENSNASSEAGINLKFPILFSSSSDSESEPFNVQRNPLHSQTGGGDDAATTTSGAARPASPPPNCAICLGRCKNKCFTNSCVHQFCFKCLAEWSKVKAECPLCKQPFRSIIHNVKSMDQFEEYLVQTPTVQMPHSPLEVTYQGPLRGFSVNGSRGFYNFSMRSYPRNAIPSRNGPITIRNYVDHDFVTGGPIPSASVAVESMPMRDPDFFRRQMPDEFGNDLPVGQLWRRYIYDRKLYALPVSDITGRFRECSARFYRANPGQIVRLIPFANRDLVCLLRNTNHNVTSVLQTLHSGLEVSNILSRSFRRRLQPFLGERTAHFIHELSNFARSPYDMIGYDDYVQYAPQSVGEEQIIEFSSSGGEETNNNNNANNNNNNLNNVDENPTSTSTDARTISRRSARRALATSSSNASPSSSFPPMSLLSFTITTTTEGSEAPGVSVAVSAGSRGAQVAAINLSTHNRAHNEVVIDLDDTVEVNGGGNGGDSATEVANGGHVASGSSNGGNGGSAVTTSTVTHSSPQVVASIALSTSSSDECEFVLERKPPHLRTPEMVSLNSESDSDVVFVEESKPVLAEATYSTSDEGGKKTPTLASLMDEQEQQREREKRRDDVQCNEPEASTSTGLRSRTLRQIVATKRSNSNRTETNLPTKWRRARFQRASKATQAYSSDNSTSTEDDNDDSDFSSRNRSRRGVSSSSGKRRGSSNARKRTIGPGRKSRKRARLSDIKVESTKQAFEQLPQESASKPTRTKRPRRSTSSRNSSKCAAQVQNYSSKNESSTEEDEKVNLKALQQRLKTSLSDVEANLNETRQEASPIAPKVLADQQNDAFVASSDSDADSILKRRQLKLASNFSSCDNLDERPSTSAAAAAASAAMKFLHPREDSDASDINNEPKNNSPSPSNPDSPAQSVSDKNGRISCPSPPSSSSLQSSMSSFQLPSTSQQHQNKQENPDVKFGARFNYSSSSDSSTNSSTSSLTQSSASATSASEDELN